MVKKNKLTTIKIIIKYYIILKLSIQIKKNQKPQLKKILL